MDYEEFFVRVKGASLEIAPSQPRRRSSPRLSNEALFHLPLIAVTILVLARDRRKPKLAEIGQFIGEIFERSLAGFKGSSQHVGWSANLRVRTVRALTFLEIAGLLTVSEGRLDVSVLGRDVIETALADDLSDLAQAIRRIERAYRDISVERQISLNLA